MPICRYEIRNEFSLADPVLYRAADKDDPEALLEGVAMAGLVGVLRQLGDLAELAAEIFRDLHEEVLATAARGHGLTIRVQQLEAEVPSVEKAFLSQTNHSPFFNNAGVDWHPNLRMSENLVTQGDLPRFVMDSYEECRGPPRLFLLDKFDVAGAGACLKRYTDPSLYKVEMSAMIDSDVHRGRKIRKAKKKGARGRNGETPEVQPLSQANLHQFLLEESVENGVSKPARRVKLKRRPQYSPFDSKTGRSYMENFLKRSSPEHQMLREITEVPRPRSSNPSREHVETKGILPPASEQNMQKFLKFETDEVAVYEAYNNVTDCVPSTFNEETGEKDIAVDGQGKTEGYLTSYQSDEFASEMDNFVDAPSTMDSEMDTDSELRVNKDFASSSIDSQQAEKQVGHLYSLSSDSRYTGDSISDDTNSSSKKEVSSFLSSDSPISSANKNLHSQEIFTDGNAPAEVPETTVVDEAVAQKAFDEVQVDPLSKQGSFDDAIVEKDSVTNDRPDFEQQLPKLDETVSTIDDEEKKINMLMDVPCSPSFSGANSQPEIGSPQSSSGEHLVDEPNSDSEPLTSSVSVAAYHTTGDSAPIPDCLLREGEYDHKDLSQFENTQSMLNTSNDISQSVVVNEKINNIENPLPGKLDDEAPKLTEIFPSDDTDTNHTRDSITSKLSEVEKLNDKLDNEDSNVISDASNHSLGIMETSLGKELTETSLTKDEIVDTKDHYSDSSIGNQIISETLILSSTKNSPDWEEEEAVLDAHYKDFIPMEETTANETPTFGNPESFEVIEPHEMGLSDSLTLTPNDVVGPGNLSCVPEYLGDSTITTGVVANEEIDPDKDVIGLEVREISSYEDTKSPSEVHNLLDESYSKTDQSDSGVMASPVSSDSDNAIAEDVIASLDHGNMADKYINCSSMVESEDASGYLSITRTELGLMEEVFAGEASTSDLSCSTVNYYDHPKLEVTHAVPHLYVNSSGKPTEAQSPNEHKRGVDTDQELSKKSGIENQVSDVICFSIKRDAEETVSEKIEIPPANQIDEELPYFGERISESSQNFSTDAPGYPKYPLGFIFPSGNTLAEINQINLDELPPLPPLPPVEWRTGRLQHALSTTESEMMKPAELMPQEISSCATSIGNVNSSVEERNHTLFPNVSEKISKEEKIEQVSSVHETIDLPPKIENEKQQERFVPLPLNSEVASPAEEDEVASKSRMVKPPRPPNPLIESIAVLDKSKLRKVAERVRPEIQKMDERDSLLEQIRAKSFNLKPAVVSRPSVKGPQTNLKVAAILEKANAIRQAFAGSDEDDEDNWSDS
ncbi:Protein SCAR2 [Striga hermonthica]|uniref:Protein SCAR n=1 Tax=Striga hermonthica TaxID=68872 RepID=A0A9N7NNP6_STRHE|nr:Protein SCAR2 [Striga hermonthica]